MFARFNENPAMILQDIKETKRYGRMDACTDDKRTDNMKTVYPLQTKFAGGIIKSCGRSVDRPIKAPSMHIQNVNKSLLGKYCLSSHSCHFVKNYFF